MQRAFPATSTDRPTFSLTRSGVLRLSMIPRAQQRPLLRRRNTQPNAFRGVAHGGIAAHSRAYGALARPERRGAGAQFGDALGGRCAQAEEVDVGELGIRGFGEVG